MSYPPAPGQGPNNPYAAPPQGQQAYGYPQQGMPPAHQAPQPMYGYPQQGGIPAYPGGPMQPKVSRMPGLVVTARVLLFVAGSLWGLFAVVLLITVLSASAGVDGVLGVETRGAAAGVGVFVFLVFGGLSALHIVPASLFGKGRVGTRVTAIIAASVNSLVPLLGILSVAASNVRPGAMLVYVLWMATTVLTVIFCSLGAAGQWFNRPRF